MREKLFRAAGTRSQGAPYSPSPKSQKAKSELEKKEGLEEGDPEEYHDEGCSIENWIKSHRFLKEWAYTEIKGEYILRKEFDVTNDHMVFFKVLPKTYVKEYIDAIDSSIHYVYRQSPGSCVLFSILQLISDHPDIYKSTPQIAKELCNLFNPRKRPTDTLNLSLFQSFKKDYNSCRNKMDTSRGKFGFMDSANIIFTAFLLLPQEVKTEKETYFRIIKCNDIPSGPKDLNRDSQLDLVKGQLKVFAREDISLIDFLKTTTSKFGCILHYEKSDKPSTSADERHAVSYEKICEGVFNIYDNWNGSTSLFREGNFKDWRGNGRLNELYVYATVEYQTSEPTDGTILIKAQTQPIKNLQKSFKDAVVSPSTKKK